MQPDVFFTETQRQRLGELMERWRAARDQGSTLPLAERAELAALSDAEVEASTRRAAALIRTFQP